MSEIKKKTAEVVADEVVDAQVPPMDYIPPFRLRFAQMGAAMRARAKGLKFDSEVDAINYVYVDTQQYKDLLGQCCDEFGIIPMYESNPVGDNGDLQVIKDDRGALVFVVSTTILIRFYDALGNGDDLPIIASGYGMGVSRGGGYAVGIAQTNAMRNLITNAFMLPTSDRESDDVKGNGLVQSFLTDETKANKRAALLEKTKSDSQYASIQYGKVLYGRIQETLAKDIPANFRTTLEKFVESKFKDGEPIALDTDPSLWIVKKVAANQIMSDLDEYN